MKEKKTRPLPTNQVEQFYCQALGQEKGGSLSNLNCHEGCAGVLLWLMCRDMMQGNGCGVCGI